MIYCLLFITFIRTTTQWEMPENDTLINERTKVSAEKVGQLMPLSETTRIAVNLPIFNFGYFLVLPRYFTMFDICTDITNNRIMKQNETNINEVLRSFMNTPTKLFSERFMDAVDSASPRKKRQLAEFSVGTGMLAMGTSVYNSIQIVNIKDTEQQIINHIRSNDKILQSTVASIIPLTETEMTVVKELNETRHSMSLIQSRL
ncbi:unnamed protein product, partial [Didymodactylos carnosus]